MEGYRTGGAGSYNHAYLRTASETESGWGGKVTVFSATVSASAYAAAVAVTGSTEHTAHVAYVVFDFSEGGGLNQTQVHYKRCLLSLSGVECDTSGDVLASSRDKIAWVDLALDSSGNPHVVWAQYDMDWNGDVFYIAYDGSAWNTVEGVALNDDNNRPAIAWADGQAHVVWEETTQHQIWHRRRTALTWTSPISLWTPTTRAPGYPDVAAGQGRVFVVWDWCSDSDPDPPCRKYHLVYRRSNDSGASWGDAREVGTDFLSFVQEYSSVDDILLQDQYLLYLRPSIALNESGWPAVVWHADRSSGDDEEDYAIHYTYAPTGDDSSVSWIDSIGIIADWHGPLGSPVVGVGQSDSEGQLLHLAYMRRQAGTDGWDVYYDSSEDKDRYRYIKMPLILRSYSLSASP
jgi:hypothetical protein